MSSIINTNSLSLLTQNNLLKSQSSLTTAIQRLSSGLRINSAKDDAAGQAIANRFSSNIKGLSQAQRNANDGISLAQTTEGALNEINNNLQRVRELTVQAANGSNSKTDLDSIQSEITQRMAEIDRTSAQTDFNGTKVLGAAADTLKIQVGSNDGETIDIGLKTINTSTLGVASFNVNGTGTANTATTKDDILKAVASTATNPTMAYISTTSNTAKYTQTVKTVTDNVAANASDVLKQAVATATVTLNTSASQKDKYTLDAGVGAAARYVAATTTSDIGSTTTTANGPAGGVASYLVPTGTGVISANVTIGGTAQQIKVDSAGNVKDDAGNQLYLDTTGNLTQNTANGGTALVAANIGKGNGGDILKSMSVGTVGTIGNSGSSTAGAQVKATGGSITVNQASGSTIKLDIGAFNGLAAVAETATMTGAGALLAGDTYTVAGLTFTSGGSGTTQAELLAAFSNLADGSNGNGVTAGGTFTAGNLTGYSTGAVATNAVTFTASAAGATADLTDSGTGVAAAVIAVATSGVTADEGTGATWNVEQKLTAADMQAKAAAGTAVVDINGAATAGGSFNIAAGANGAVTGSVTNSAVYVDKTTVPATPALVDTGVSGATTTTTVTNDYYVQAGGVVTDGSGNKVFNDSASTGMFTLKDRSGATSTVDAMKVIDAALAKVDGLRGSLGAVQNRFDSVISNLGSTITNLSASRSRIEDADYATEVSNMTRAQILQQAGTSVLAKANQSTQGVMSLLQ